MALDEAHQLFNVIFFIFHHLVPESLAVRTVTSVF